MSSGGREIFVERSSTLTISASGKGALQEPLLALPRFLSTGFWLLCLGLFLRVWFPGGDMGAILWTL